MEENSSNLSPAALKQAVTESGDAESQLSLIDIINFLVHSSFPHFYDGIIHCFVIIIAV